MIDDIVSDEILSELAFVADYPLNVNRVNSGEFRLFGDVGVDSACGEAICWRNLPRTQRLHGIPNGSAGGGRPHDSRTGVRRYKKRRGFRTGLSYGNIEIALVIPG